MPRRLRRSHAAQLALLVPLCASLAGCGTILAGEDPGPPPDPLAPEVVGARVVATHAADAALADAAASVTPTNRKKAPPKKEPAADLPGEGGHRKYLGYIVRIYYNDQLQAVRADPTRLLNLFPPPFTAPQ